MKRAFTLHLRQLHAFLVLLEGVWVKSLLPLAICKETESDRQALLCFKSRLSGPAGVLASWSNKSFDVCEWHGITCSKPCPRRVIALDLESEGMSGSISPCVANLTSIARLQLSNNNLSGGIPSVGLLPRLRDLNLSRSNLEGKIPSSLGNLSSLVDLRLTGNNLVRSIPESLGYISPLQILALTANNLSGTVPPSLFNMSSPTFLSLGNNSLVGRLPHNISYTLPNIQTLVLSTNKFDGPIPASLPKVYNLRLFVSFTCITTH
ncbi:unnamed protein product [Triticum turgidum subsp. durum]|uniref:Leucine-rich repeat-containing N-terminal plant-type domain-containing protein n=1 Tax=Triticum turgidum subsp. durum TaxID=4567 RepID=A0A9R1AV32_TRITD|nr:unnamed protein product [Triticum turgidum subsp. durum]